MASRASRLRALAPLALPPFFFELIRACRACLPVPRRLLLSASSPAPPPQRLLLVLLCLVVSGESARAREREAPRLCRPRLFSVSPSAGGARLPKRGVYSAVLCVGLLWVYPSPGSSRERDAGSGTGSRSGRCPSRQAQTARHAPPSNPMRHGSFCRFWILYLDLLFIFPRTTEPIRSARPLDCEP